MSKFRALRRYSAIATALAWTGLRRPGTLIKSIRRVLDGIANQHPELLQASGYVEEVGREIPCVVPLDLDVRPEGERHLNVLVPGMAKNAMSGGPNTAINLAYRLAARGLPVRFLSTDVPKDKDEEGVWKHIQRLTGINERFPHVSIHSANPGAPAVSIGANDLFLATAWWTAQRVKLALPRMRARRFLYMVQEVESGLYPWSSQFALAEETYGLDFIGIVNERLVFDHLAHRQVGRFGEPGFEDRCVVFEPSVDREKFHPYDREEGTPARRRLVFYARPNAPRNLFELGVAALRRAVAEGAFPADQWDLLYMGEPLPEGDLGHGQVIRPTPWLGFDDYAALLRGSDVGLSLMFSPHTSYPPLEMAACGTQVVTNTYSVKTADRLRGLSECIIPVAPTVEALTEGLLTAARRIEGTEHRPRAGVDVPRSWDEVFDAVVPRLLQLIGEIDETPSESVAA